MNKSAAMFLVDSSVRAVDCIYNPPEIKRSQRDDRNNRYTFKTNIQDLKIGDLVIVPSESRFHMCVVEVVKLDTNVDFDSTYDYKWIIDRIDREAFGQVLEQEAKAIDVISGAELNRKRAELRKDLMSDPATAEAIKALPNFSNEGMVSARNTAVDGDQG